MIKLLSLVLAIHVGDREYDPNPEILVKPVSKHAAACVMLTSWWMIDGVGGEDVDDQCFEYSLGSHQLEGLDNEFIHVIFFTFPFEWREYYENKYKWPEAEEICWELEVGSRSRFNQCIDYRKFPELLPNVCK